MCLRLLAVATLQLLLLCACVLSAFSSPKPVAADGRPAAFGLPQTMYFPPSLLKAVMQTNPGVLSDLKLIYVRARLLLLR